MLLAHNGLKYVRKEAKKCLENKVLILIKNSIQHVFQNTLIFSKFCEANLNHVFKGRFKMYSKVDSRKPKENLKFYSLLRQKKIVEGFP